VRGTLQVVRLLQQRRKPVLGGQQGLHLDGVVVQRELLRLGRHT
jgi:hypothetical protein